uniref:Uncharacterized protein n=1 Tax=Plectus sambesii TaxID=2011161 RepID=A0A914V148_9BILA
MVNKQSKLAQALVAKELADRLADTQITVNVVSPGLVQTKLQRELGHQSFFLSRWIVSLTGFLFMRKQSPEQAVRSILYVAADPSLDRVSGKFFKSLDEVPWNATVLDDKERLKMWLTSEKWTRLQEQIRQTKSTIEHSVPTQELLKNDKAVDKVTAASDHVSSSSWWGWLKLW